ncbi:MAG TPA: efflux transporter outer membrane subunit [Myxococcaceae bacterium]|jgi:NodT family efflux transporter outer membrane factor (OMF) lipoprotein
MSIHRRGWCWLIGALLMLGGCAVGPKFTKPEAAVPERWGAKDDPRIATQAATDVQWWKTFGDPTLDRLVELASGQNLSLQAAGLRIMEARAQLGVATGRQYPQLQTANANVTAAGLSETAPNASGLERNYVDYQLGFDAVWELDFWGKYRRGVEAETAGLLASVADYYNAFVSVTAEVARTYVLVRTFEVRLALAQENVRVQEEGLRIAESRFRNGATSELDVSQATTLLESTRATIPGLQTGLQQARNALSTLLGQPPGAVEALLDGPGEIPKVPEQVAVSVPAELLRRRPDIRGAELQAAAQCARVGVAEADLYPSFSLFGSLGWQASNIGSAGSNLFSLDSLFYSVGPRVSWPFFNYGRLKNGVRVQDARFQQQLVNYRDTVLRAVREVDDSMVGFLNAQQTMVFQQSSVKAAQRSATLAMVQYREGAVDFQRVLDAQRSLLQEQNNLAETRSSVTTNLIALYKALGGGWEPRQDQPVIPAPVQRQMEERTNWGDLLSQPRGPEAVPNPPPPPQKL